MSATPSTTQRQWYWLAAAPVPMLLLAIIVTRVTGVRVAPTPSQVLFPIEVLTRMLPALVVIVMTAMTFLRRGTPGVLLLGCGVAMWAATGFVNTFLLALSPNFGITVTNLGLGLAAVCHLAGVSPAGARKVAARGLGLVIGYGLVLVAVGLVSWITWQGWLPRFFVEGHGGTPIRFFVLSAAMVMFVLSALLLSARQQSASSRFAFWYSLALWLIALSIFGMLIQVSRDNMQNWMNRITQYLGSIYMLIAAITSLRESGGAWLLPLEDALRESEEFNKAVLDTAGCLIVALDSAGHIQRFNLACEVTTGYAATEVLGRVFWDFLVPQEDMEGVSLTWNRLQAGDFPNSHENHWIGKNGACRLIEWTNSAMIRDGHIVSIIAAGRDITEQRQAEETLRESEVRERERAEELTVLLESIPAGVYISHDPDCRHITGNHTADEILRIPLGNELSLSAPEDIKPLHFRTMKDGRELRLDELPAQRAARGEHIRDFEFTLAFDDGILRHVLGYGTPLFDQQGAPRGSVAILIDITARKQAEAELRDSEERFFKSFRSNPSALSITRADDSRYVDVNETYLLLLEYERNEVIGRTAMSLNLYPNPEERDAVIAQLFEQGSVRDAELNVRTKSGKIRRVIFSLETVIINGQPHVLASFIDISERKLIEEALQASLHEKEVLLKEIHHRVKNNMQVISSLISLQVNTLNDPALRPLFDDLSHRVRAMALVHEKLYQSESLAAVDFAEYTRSLLASLWRAHGQEAASVRLTQHLEPVSISIEQAVPCGLLLNELVTNALKHAFRDRADGELTVALHADSQGTVCLTVRDNGLGLPADWRQSPSLGLKLVQMLSRQLDGALDVRTECGTAFSVTFTPPSTSPPGEARPA